MLNEAVLLSRLGKSITKGGLWWTPMDLANHQELLEGHHP